MPIDNLFIIQGSWYNKIVVMTIDFALLLVLGALVYFWLREKVGHWALLPTFLVMLMPNFINESPLLSLSLLLAIVGFFNFIIHPRRFSLIIAGISLGIAQLIDQSNFILLIYFLIITSLFYCISLIRDWRFKKRIIDYLKALFVIFIIAIVVFYLSRLVLTRDFEITNMDFVNHFNLSNLNYSSHQLSDITSQPIPAIILVVAAFIFYCLTILQSRKGFDKFFVANNFIELALLIFVVFYWYVGVFITPIVPVIYVLMVQPFKNLIVNKNQKEIMIVIGHEKISFSIKWIVLGALLLWYLVNTVYIYVNVNSI